MSLVDTSFNKQVELFYGSLQMKLIESIDPIHHHYITSINHLLLSDHQFIEQSDNKTF